MRGRVSRTLPTGQSRYFARFVSPSTGLAPRGRVNKARRRVTRVFCARREALDGLDAAQSGQSKPVDGSVGTIFSLREPVDGLDAAQSGESKPVDGSVGIGCVLREPVDGLVLRSQVSGSPSTGQSRHFTHSASETIRIFVYQPSVRDQGLALGHRNG